MNQDKISGNHSKSDDWTYPSQGITERQPEEITEIIVDNTTALLRVFNSDQRRIFINQAWIDFTGSVLTGEHALTENMHPDTSGPYKMAWEQAVSQNRPFETMYLLLHKSGQYRWVREVTKPVISSGGTCDMYLSTAIDIHEGKERETQLSNKWSSVLRGSFHDLRANIGIVSGASSLLQLMEKKEDRDNALEMIQRNVRQMQSVMDHLLAQFAEELK